MNTKKFNIHFVLGIAWIAFVIGLSVDNVNESTTMKPGEKFGWILPVATAFFTVVPFVFGYLAGRRDD